MQIVNGSITQAVERLNQINITVLKGRIERGALLLQLKNDKSYLGHDSWVNSWADFLDCININRETARQDMEVFQEFAEALTQRPDLLNTCSYERLIRLLPVVRLRKKEGRKVGKIMLLEMTARSKREDFDNNLKEMKGLAPNDKCVDPSNCDAPKIILERCTTCGVTYRRKDLENG